MLARIFATPIGGCHDGRRTNRGAHYHRSVHVDALLGTVDLQMATVRLLGHHQSRVDGVHLTGWRKHVVDVAVWRYCLIER